MRRFVDLRLLAAVLAMIVPGPLVAGEAAAPYLLARSLQMLQDQVISGSRAALAEQPALLDRMGMGFAELPGDGWKDARNVRALVIYLVNGGPPSVVRKLLSSGLDFGPKQDLVRALLAFAERKDDAAEQLDKFDAKALEPEIGGSVALAQGMASERKPEKALEYLAIARALASGTLIEEAAYRREISLLLEQKKREQAVQHATRYLWRFGNSVYAADVTGYLGESVVPVLAKNNKMEKLQAFLGELKADSRREVLLGLGKGALLSGQLDVAEFAGKSIMAASPKEPSVLARAQFFQSVKKAFANDASASAEDLLSLDRSLLVRTERTTLEAALTIASLVRSEVRATPQEPPSGEVPQIIVRARNAVKQADLDIQGTLLP